MMLTVFRSRLWPEAHEESMQWAARMGHLARSMPGIYS
jgi:hypothetical protein